MAERWCSSVVDRPRRCWALMVRLKPGGTMEDAVKARSATSMQTVGATLAAVGVAAGAAGLVMWLMAPAEPAKTTTLIVAPVPGGAAVMLTGELP